MAPSERPFKARCGGIFRACFGIKSKDNTCGVSATHGKVYRAPLDASTTSSTPPTEGASPVSRVTRSPRRASEPSSNTRPVQKPIHPRERCAQINARNGAHVHGRSTPNPRDRRGAGPDSTNGNRPPAIRRNPSSGKTLAEEATSPGGSIHIPRSRPHGYEKRSANSAPILPFIAKANSSDLMSFSEAAATRPRPRPRPHSRLRRRRHSRVITVIHHNFPITAVPEIVPDDSISARAYDEEDTPLAYYLPIQQYHTYAAAHQLRIVKPLLKAEAGRMGRVNHYPVHVSRAPSVRSQSGLILTEEALDYGNAVSGPVDEFSPVSVDQRCAAFLESLPSSPDSVSETSKPVAETSETTLVATQRTKRAPARYRRKQQSESEEEDAIVQAAAITTEKQAKPEISDLPLVAKAHDSVREEVWSNNLLDSLNEIGADEANAYAPQHA